VLRFYGQNGMSGVLEAKTSRIVEVIVSSVRPAELMMGKLIGIGGVAFTQILVWLLAATLLGGGAVGMVPGGIHIPQLPPALLVHFVFYFVTGFLMYSALYALLGAMNNSEQEARQMVMRVTMPLI